MRVPIRLRYRRKIIQTIQTHIDPFRRSIPAIDITINDAAADAIYIARRSGLAPDKPPTETRDHENHH